MPKVLNMIGIIHAKIPLYMDGDNIRLRPLRFSDGSLIIKALNDDLILKAHGLNKPINSSWLSLWWWIKKTFIPAYFIECDSRQIGFVGLYNLMIGKTAEMSLIIFDGNNRRMGYGGRAFKLLVHGLKRHSIVNEIIVKVKADNNDALSFWRKLGFLDASISDDIISMSMDLQRQMT